MKWSNSKSENNPRHAGLRQVLFEIILKRVLMIPGMESLLGLGNHFRYPRGKLGRYLARQMNLAHESLTLWGLSKLEIASDSVILDVGCGGGKTVNKLAYLVPRGRVFGIDISHDMVEFSRNVNKKLIVQNRVQIVEGSVEKMSFPDGFFDLVTAFETYYFWPNFVETLKEIRRVLKSNGRLLLVSEMVKDGVYEVENAKLIRKAHVHLIPLRVIQNMMLSIGFVDIQVFVENNSTWNAVLAKKP